MNLPELKRKSERDFIRYRKGSIECIYNANASKVTNIGKNNGAEHRLCFEVATKEESIEIECDRIIARLGAFPPRKFLDSCGIKFPRTNQTQFPLSQENTNQMLRAFI